MEDRHSLTGSWGGKGTLLVFLLPFFLIVHVNKVIVDLEPLAQLE